MYYDYKIAEYAINNTDNSFIYAIIGLSYYCFEYDLSKSVTKSRCLYNYRELFNDIHNYCIEEDENRYIIKIFNVNKLGQFI